jgi:hypothetical protein
VRRLILTLVLLGAVPPEASAADAFCTALQRLTDSAASNFQHLSNSGRNMPGSVNEYRSTVQFAGSVHAAMFAVMVRAPSDPPSPLLQQRFTALQADIGRCLPDAQKGPVEQIQGGSRVIWTLPRAIVLLRRDNGMGHASTAEVHIAVGSRW